MTDRHDEAEDDEREVLDPLGHRARDDRRGRSGEHELEEELGISGTPVQADRAVVALVVVARGGAVVRAASP